jgi:hypothetical protein
MSFVTIGPGNAVIFLRVWVKFQSRVYRETIRHFESEVPVVVVPCTTSQRTALLPRRSMFTVRYELTPWSRVLLEKLTAPHLNSSKSPPPFYGTRRFITPFTRARHRSLSWTRATQSMPHNTSWRSILILSSLRYELNIRIYLVLILQLVCQRSILMQFSMTFLCSRLLIFSGRHSVFP